MQLSNNTFNNTQVRPMLHAEQIMIVFLVMLVVAMHISLDMLDSMLCVRQEVITFKETGILNGWATVSDALMKIAP